MSATFPTITRKAPTHTVRTIVLGGYAALAESAWMGFAQASEIIDSLRPAPGFGRRAVVPRFPRFQLRALLTREFTIAEASFILMASFFTSALLGAVRQILFNAQFGVGMAANAYYAAFRLPDTLFSLIAGGALSSAMIPVLLNTVREGGEAAGARLIQLVLTTLLTFFALIVLLVELFAPGLVQGVLAPGFDAATSQLTVTLTRIMLLQPLILAVASVATAVLNSRNQFLLTGLSVISYNVALILGILAARLVPALGIYGPTLGVILGAIFQVLILSPAFRTPGHGLRLAWNFTDRRLREVVALLIPNGLAVGVNYAGNIADTAFASTAAEGAALGAIYNGWLLVGLPIALLGQAVGQAVFPRLAAAAESGQWTTLRRSLAGALGAALGLSLFALAALFYLGRPVIQILFERGEFNAAAGELTFQVLTAYALALPAYVGTEVITRGLIALRDTRTPLLTNLCQLAGRVAIMTLFVSRVGVIAIPTALAVTAVLETALLGAVLFVKLHRLR
uniref:Putative peptidoglycan lipid II flippase MurJ n=1 Tax=uncultured bacterium A1Q1_fos_485 TaxID=1256576 RepID=L7VUB5_9BACT|nr:putative peptidoglycan lipid II flippase MurJ [uncultured bacterium A1Q1_fos_485]